MTQPPSPPEPEAAGFWLEVHEAGLPARVVPVDRALVVGRDAEGLLLDDPTVSRRHLAIEPTEHGLHCTDLGSANGTYVDGRRLEGSTTVGAGTVLRVGRAELRVHHARRAAAEPDAHLAPVFEPGELPGRASAAVRDLTRANRSRRRQPPG